MDKIAKYRALIKQVIEMYAHPDSHTVFEEYETQTVYDDKRGYYYLMDIGWTSNSKRVHGCILHLDLKNDKIWIQKDGTEYGAANELIDLGVPKEDIVLAFQSPQRRKLIEGYALA